MVGHNRSKITLDDRYDYYPSINKDQLLIGFSAYRNQKLSPKAYIQPHCEVILHPTFEISKDIYVDSNFDGIKETDGTGLNPSFNFGFSVILGPDKKYKSFVRIGPSIGFYKEITTYSINVGIIIPIGGLNNEIDDEDDW